MSIKIYIIAIFFVFSFSLKETIYTYKAMIELDLPLDENVCKYIDQDKSVIYLKPCKKGFKCGESESNISICIPNNLLSKLGEKCNCDNDCLVGHCESNKCTFSEDDKPFYVENEEIYRCGNELIFTYDNDICINKLNFDYLENFCVYTKNNSNPKEVNIEPVKPFYMCGEYGTVTEEQTDLQLNTYFIKSCKIGELKNGIKSIHEYTCETGFRSILGDDLVCDDIKEVIGAGKNEEGLAFVEYDFEIAGKKYITEELYDAGFFYRNYFTGELEPYDQKYIQAFREYVSILKKNEKNCAAKSHDYYFNPLHCGIKEVYDAYFYLNHMCLYQNNTKEAQMILDYLKNQEFQEKEYFEKIEITENITDQYYDIITDNIYLFQIVNENYFYYFRIQDGDNILFYVYDEKTNIKNITNQNRYFISGDKIYVKFTSENKDKTTILINYLNNYDKINSFETIKNGENFIIKTSVDSLAYFDSVENNSIIYISKDYKDFKFGNEEKITGKFYNIKANEVYFVRNYLHFYPSVSKKYLYQLDLEEKQIDIVDGEINYLYLEKNKNYILNFSNSKFNKMITLSRKTFNSAITILNNEKESILNNKSPYYKVDENFKSNLILKVADNDAFIEFLSETDNYEILDELSKYDYPIKTKTIIILLQENSNSKDFYFRFQSNKPFKYSLALGLTNSKNYLYVSNSNKVKNLNNLPVEGNYQEGFILRCPFRYLNLFEKEILSLAINIEKEDEQIVTISYNQDSLISILLDEKLNETYCENVKKNILKILDIYIYTDIAKNPPKINDISNYHHRPIDLISEIEKMETVNRTFYEFYQELKTILLTVRDYHFDIYSFETPNKIKFGQYMAVLPFNFVIKDYDGINRIFIEKNGFYKSFPNQQNFIDSHLDIPIKSINDIDPFDYIQNWKFQKVKNYHSEFSFLMSGNKITAFYLFDNPLNYSDITMNDYEFEDNKTLKMGYGISSPKNDQLSQEFHKYFMNELNNNNKIFLPPINEIYDQFLISKGLKKEVKLENSNSINWDITLNENKYFMKCRIDEENKVNVLVQNSFLINLEKAIGAALNCAKLFYSNNYPLIIIQSKNNGGYNNLYMIMHQIFQIRTLDKTLYSFRFSNSSIEFFNDSSFNGINPETCERVTTFEDLGSETDYYEYNNLKVQHKRTKPFDNIRMEYREALRDFREEFQNSKNLKKPTDIIIFTDSFSFSSGSGFIKAFQNTGGAIVVGFYGNPKMKDKDLFDGSQSSSPVNSLKGTDIEKNLTDLGFSIGGVTIGETFNDSYKNNTIPREYALDPVDERVNIYSDYSDTLYEKFIEEGLKIFEKYKNQCNSKNKRLLLHDEIKCKDIIGREFEHGGYKCKENNEWDKDNCEGYYCDIGYYFSQSEKKCIKDCVYNKTTKGIFIYDKETNKEFEINNNLTYYFYIRNYPYQYYYLFNASENYMKNHPKIFFSESDKDIIIENEKSTENYKIKINAINPEINPNLDILNYKIDYLYLEQNILTVGKKIISFNSKNRHYLYLNNILHKNNIICKIAKFSEEMSYEDILKINNNYYAEYKDIYNLESNILYFIYFEFIEFDQIHIKLNPYIDPVNKIEIKDFSKNVLYLEKDKKYILKILEPNLKVMLKLSRTTINSEIIIFGKGKLNSDNLYYKVNSEEIELSINKENALIEILFKQNDSDIIEMKDLIGKSDLKLNKAYNLIKIPKEYANKVISFNFLDIKESIFTIYRGYTKLPYSFIYDINEDLNQFEKDNFTIIIDEQYQENVKLMENEIYYVMVHILENEVNLDITIEEKSDDKEKKVGKKKELKGWVIALIILGGIILLALISVLLIIILRKNKISNKEIEEKIENLNEFKDI